MMADQIKYPCIVCKNPIASKCSACGNVAYCSKAHQKSDWKTHKIQCQAWKIAESSELGRYLIAVRDIKPGEIILQEKPLVLCPPRVTLPVCLGCYTEFEDDDNTAAPENNFSQRFAKPVLCSKKCGFPTCGSQRCAEASVHEPECTAAWSRGGVKIRNFGNVHPTYEAIGILRMISLKNKDTEKWSKIMALKSHFDSPIQNPDGETEEMLKERKKDSQRTVSLIQDFFRMDSISKDEILKLLGILETNAHEIPIPDENGQVSKHLIGVYSSSSLLEHNCVPNCIKTWNEEHEIQIRASVSIKKGDHISISYVDPMWGTADRVHFLRMSKNFNCRCIRCLDPTELSTHLSSVRCQHASCLANFESQNTFKGLIVPEDPNNVEREWKCNSCFEIYSPAYVMSVVEKVGRELEILHQKYGDIEAEEVFLKKFSKMLSPNHFYLLEIKLGLAQIYGRTHDEPLPLLSPKKLCRKRQLCEELLNVFNVILPGYNRLRALILYELQATVSTISKMRRAVEEISIPKHRDELLMCSKWLTEAVKVMNWEHKNSIERKRAEGGELELDELIHLIQACSI